MVTKHRWLTDTCACTACTELRRTAQADAQSRQEDEALEAPPRSGDWKKVLMRPEYSKTVMTGRAELMNAADHELIDKVRRGGIITVDDALKLKPNWNPMLIKHPPLTVPVAGRKGRKTRDSDQGAVFRNAHRLLIDGAVFGRKVRERTASVLLDASGSMSIGEDDIQGLCKRYPAGIIAMYNGHSTGGELIVLAKNGRCVEMIPHRYGMNTCDGPALEWLAKQTTPRYWVSDAAVTEVGDHITLRASLQCQALVQRHGVKRFDTINKLLKGT